MQYGAYIAYFEKLNPKILHNWMFHPSVLGRIIGKIAAVPHIISSRRNSNIGGDLREQINRLTVKLDSVIIAVSESVKLIETQRSGVAPNKIVTIYNGVDETKFHVASKDTKRELRAKLGLPSNSVVIGHIGRLHPQKGHEFLLKAIPKIPNAHFLMIGSGEDAGIWLPKFQEQARQLKINNRVHWLGERDDIPLLLAGLDILVLPSLWEGMPNVALEAMCSRLPIVATAVDGTQEVILNGETGILIPPADVRAIANAITKLIQNPDLAMKMGQAGRNRVLSSFTVKQMVEKTEEVYRQLIISG